MRRAGALAVVIAAALGLAGRAPAWAQGFPWPAPPPPPAEPASPESSASAPSESAPAASAPSVEAPGRQVRIVNETHHRMMHFYAQVVSANDWGEDILGDDVVAAGGDATINIQGSPGYCQYDLRAVFDDGETQERHVNVCEATSYRFSDPAPEAGAHGAPK